MTIPIPHRPSGFLKGAAAADVTLDVFVDIQCPHSKRLWPTLMSVMDHYQAESISLKTHLITLSNHRQAWDMTLALFAFAEGNAERFYAFASYLYEHQAQFYNGVFKHKTHADLQQLAAELASQNGPIDQPSFIQRMNDNDIYVLARTPIRYAATRSIWATPTILINNASTVPVDHESSFQEWQNLLDPLLD